jgi:serine/threonine-protein kinase
MLPQRYQQIAGEATLGGFGSVQRVLDTFLDRVVLFKSMQDKENNAQLLNEIKGLSKARSRHVVEIYDVIKDPDDSVAGIIIELLNGRDYINFHCEAASNPNILLKIIYQISAALQDLHSVDIIHRDLKLDNFRASESGILKLFDFGISAFGNDYKTINNRGTLVYAAPELYVSGARITKEMDIYAFGICVWALVSIDFPPELLERPPQQSSKVASIATMIPGALPVEIINLIDSCLDPLPNHRPTASQLTHELKKNLIRGKHKGKFSRSNAAVFELSDTTNNVRVKIGALGEIKVVYDGIHFEITEVNGSVFVNNKIATIGMILHDACVLTFGDNTLGAGREWVSFSSSHPEIIL